MQKTEPKFYLKGKPIKLADCTDDSIRALVSLGEENVATDLKLISTLSDMLEHARRKLICDRGELCEFERLRQWYNDHRGYLGDKEGEGAGNPADDAGDNSPVH